MQGVRRNPFAGVPKCAENRIPKRDSSTNAFSVYSIWLGLLPVLLSVLLSMGRAEGCRTLVWLVERFTGTFYLL